MTLKKHGPALSNWMRIWKIKLFDACKAGEAYKKISKHFQLAISAEWNVIMKWQLKETVQVKSRSGTSWLQITFEVCWKERQRKPSQLHRGKLSWHRSDETRPHCSALQNQRALFIRIITRKQVNIFKEMFGNEYCACIFFKLSPKSCWEKEHWGAFDGRTPRQVLSIDSARGLCDRKCLKHCTQTEFFFF